MWPCSGVLRWVESLPPQGTGVIKHIKCIRVHAHTSRANTHVSSHILIMLITWTVRPVLTRGVVQWQDGSHYLEDRWARDYTLPVLDIDQVGS